MSLRRAAKREHKYGAKATVVDGIRFASQKEARRYQELKLLEKAGEIWELELQPRFPLRVPSTSGYLMRAARALTEGGSFVIGEYRADFKYWDASTEPYVVEDVKGFDTPLSKWKRRHVQAQYGITVRLT
jgi:hypothetical protein